MSTMLATVAQGGGVPTLVVIVGVIAAIAMFGSAVWAFRDARRRSFSNAGWIMMCCLLNFPFPVLTYWLVTRSLDASSSGA